MNERLRILLVDDDPASCRALGAHLARQGDEVHVADEARGVQGMLAARAYDVVLCDVRSPRLDAGAFCDAVRVRSPDAATVLMSAFASVEHVAAALRHGVYDYLLKPVEPQQVTTMLSRVRDRIEMRRKVDALRNALSVRDAFATVMTGGPTMAAVNLLARRAAASEVPVLVIGEEGTGRTLLARAIHALSSRADGPFEVVNCTRDPARVATDLFGAQARGVGAGAVARAGGGTLALASVTALQQEARVRLLHACTQPGAPRVIATSAGVPTAKVRREERRSELLAWVRGLEILMPPLRERPEDVPTLVEHYALVAVGAHGRPPRVAPDVMAALIDAPWPGNLGELETVIGEAVARAAGRDVITVDHMPPDIAALVDNGSSLVGQVEAYERAVVRRALESVGGAVGRAAAALGVPERTLRRKMRQFGISKETFRKSSRYLHLLMGEPTS